MHFLKTGVRGRAGLLAAIAAAVGLLAVFSSSADAAGTFPNLDATVAVSQFIIPGEPTARTVGSLAAATQPPFTLAVGDTSVFPPSGQFIVTDGIWGQGLKDGAEIMTYDSKAGNSFHVTQRGPQKVTVPPMIKKLHPDNSLVKLATLLTTGVTATDGLQTDLTAAITATAGGCTIDAGTTHATCGAIAPFPITVASTAGYPATGYITIAHQADQTSNVSGGQATEYLHYSSVVDGTHLQIDNRALEPTNRAYPHKANNIIMPGPIGTVGKSKVTLHFQMNVKSSVGFFPAGNLMVCDATNPLSNCELIGHNNGATKIKVPSGTEFHSTGRGEATAWENKTPIVAHAAGSIVTGADGYLMCRNRSNEPGVDSDLGTPGFQEPASQVPGTSVGVGAVCYTNTQPATGGPKPGPSLAPKKLVGQDLIVINSINGQPFLSTGGYCHVILGAVGIGASNCPGTPPMPFDNNGPTDGSLTLGSPCIIDFTPGVNLQVLVTLVINKNLGVAGGGTIKVVLDAVHDAIPNNGDECDDPAGTDTILSTNYIYTPGACTPACSPAADPTKNDTDRDGCTDDRELSSTQNSGGLRDPWNPYDYADINHDGAVSVPVDILQVANSLGAVPPNDRRDRGALNYGPFAWNKSEPNGSIDVPNDILGVALQFGHSCPHVHTGYAVPPAWPAGPGPWYGTGIVANH